MFFFKSRQKTEEITPPQPPFPNLEFEEEKQDEQVLDKALDPNYSKEVTKLEFKEPKRALKQNTGASKLQKMNYKKAVLPKQISKSKHFKKPTPTKRLGKRQISARKELKVPRMVDFPKLGEGIGLEDLDLHLSKELDSSRIELPDTLEVFDIEKLDKDLNQETKKPKEILEAEEEIKSAIEKIKEKEKPSFFKRLFSKLKKTKIPSTTYLSSDFPAKENLLEKPQQENVSQEIDQVSLILNNIRKAREALARFDLESAKNNYIEIMRLYNRIKPEAQAKVYHDISDLYFERKSAEELKV